MKKIIFFILNNLFVFSLAIADDDATRDKPNDKKNGGDQNPIALEDVYVTGSNIKKSKTDSSGALRVIDADEIERSGAKSIKELFKKIPGNFQGVDEDSLDSFERQRKTATQIG
jgi:outer membrane cobalamin receptor